MFITPLMMKRKKGIALGGTVKSMYHCDGAEGSTTITDETGARTFTCGTGCTITSAAGAFGGFAHKSTGAGVSTKAQDGSGDFYFGTNNFSIECRIKANTLSNNTCFLVIGAQASNGIYTFSIWNISGKWYFDCYDSSNIRHLYSSNVTITTTDWFHFEFSKTGGTLYYFINGVLVYSLSGQSSVNYGTTASYPMVTIGGTHGNLYRTSAFVEEIVVTSGGGGHTSNFTPPTSAYTYQ